MEVRTRAVGQQPDPELEVWIGRALAAHPGSDEEKSESADQVAGLFRGRMETLLADLPADIVRGVSR